LKAFRLFKGKTVGWPAAPLSRIRQEKVVKSKGSSNM
jgi:hypothetical protein